MRLQNIITNSQFLYSLLGELFEKVIAHKWGVHGRLGIWVWMKFRIEYFVISGCYFINY